MRDQSVTGADVRSDVDLAKQEIRLPTARMRTGISILIAETAKINSKNHWYPFVIGSGVTLAIVAITNLFI